MDDVLIGLTLQAPGVFYPSHFHEPPEMYGVISGAVEWQVGAESPYVAKAPGDVIVHESNEPHSMRALGAPVLTWAIWPYGAGSPVTMPSLDSRFT